MILSNVAIQKCLDEGSLVIEPEPSPRRPTPGQTCPYQTSSVDLLLGEEIAFFRDEQQAVIDLRNGDFLSRVGSQFETTLLKDDEPFILKPGRLVLGRTFERVELPIHEEKTCLAARVEGRSSHARCGLLVHFTAPTIHAGFAGSITLELINLGPYSLALYPKTPICQLIVETVEGVPFRNDSQFQKQTRPGGLT
ncbi:dCTP deaminase [Thalassoglobus sp. JC818]|uniref:dCTP deaminase n=1 Tax=Thalassoglobus sp. JC818 TaxID=3232136 RepID=UPI00345AACB5